MSSYCLNNYQSNDQFYFNGNTVKISQTNELEQNQNSFYNFSKNEPKKEKNDKENNYFQLFRLDSNKLREFIRYHRELMIKLEKQNSSLNNLEENNLMD